MYNGINNVAMEKLKLKLQEFVNKIKYKGKLKCQEFQIEKRLFLMPIP